MQKQRWKNKSTAHNTIYINTNVHNCGVYAAQTTSSGRHHVCIVHPQTNSPKKQSNTPPYPPAPTTAARAHRSRNLPGWYLCAAVLLFMRGFSA